MNGPVEESGKVASSIVDALRNQPLALALIVVNVLFLGVAGYFMHVFFQELGVASTRKDEMITQLVSICTEKKTQADQQQPQTMRVTP